MRSVSIALVIALLAFNTLALLPSTGAFHPYLSGASLVLAVFLLGSILVSSGKKAEPGHGGGRVPIVGQARRNLGLAFT